MDPRLSVWALVLLGPALVFALHPTLSLEPREKLCGHHFVRALVRLCGGPRWSPEVGRSSAGGDQMGSHCVAQAGLKLLTSSDPSTLASQSTDKCAVNCYSGWRDHICSMGWWLSTTLHWYLVCNPSPRPLTIIATTGQLPPTLHAAAVSVVAPDKT
ncbi:tyrosine-protein kinase JAK3 isoform X2 [Nycticebus coucang]|uniref:tyrosine-protein kinase JAK3 isoform X2 n=1 Tax=Nycticebus coucang TaxID=9470 RepID=UPI00234CC210|nr:tyrosine-protein kinase JAK3 isoform X2 [Nycticebus coucang]